MAKASGTDRLFREELPRLVHQHGTSFRAVAKEAGVDASYVHQVVKGKRAPSETLLLGAAAHFELPPEHFREYRELIVLEGVREDPALLDHIYGIVSKAREATR